jgi:hypothetical protein
VGAEEKNLGIRGEIARNSGTDGRIATIRKRIGLPEKRIISEKAMAEIRFIADATGMTDLFKEIETKKDVEKKWNYGSPADLVKIKRGPHQKFVDIDDEREEKDRISHQDTKAQRVGDKDGRPKTEDRGPKTGEKE